MRFGGHQTFPVREGWLSKALELLRDDQTAWVEKDLSDHLGVGSNMAKSIEHWIQVTGLASRRTAKETHKNRVKYEMTDLGRTILEHDPFFTHEDTWWLLHINVVNDSNNAVTWDWFFNEFSEQRFDKNHVVNKLIRREHQIATKPASQNTIERDVSCFLSTYAVPVPRDKRDPEEDLGSPFQELRVMSALRASGTYEVHRRTRDVTPEVLLFSILRSFPKSETTIDFTFTYLTRVHSGPLQTLVLNSEGLFDALLKIENESPEYGLAIRGLAGDRQITLPPISMVDVVRNMYRKAV